MRDFPTPLPERMRGLPVDRRGYPVPKFVEWIDGEPDFRVMSGEHLSRAIKFNECWICGHRLGRHKTFVIGPMCVCNRISAEPPSHTECAEFAAMACPFLTLPKATRRDAKLPEGVLPPPGEMIPRNPGVTCLWTTPTYKLKQVGRGVLFEIGEPERLAFFAKARPATRQEVDESIRTGLPILERSAEQEGPYAVAELAKAVEAMWKRVDLALPADLPDIDLPELMKEAGS